ncbi:MAG: hypothetical protein QGG36_11715, partial [Pirellulaceae bacterium]|nr:hypothetical protein [Pirellulaceae bacterium]
LGILVARAARRRAWLSGVVVGTLGGLVAVGIQGQDWLLHLAKLKAEMMTGPEIDEVRRTYVAAAVLTVVVGALLATIATGCYQQIVWATASGERSLASTLRRRPWRSAAVISVIGFAGIGAANLELLMAPHSWPPRFRIQLEQIENPVVIRHGIYTFRDGSLSRNGDWLSVETHIPGYGRATGVSEVYQLDPWPHVVPFSTHPAKVSFVAFDCDKNRIAFVERFGEPYQGRPSERHRLRVMDLERQTSETLTDSLRDSDVHSLQWTADGSLLIYYMDGRDRNSLCTRFDPHDGGWRREKWRGGVVCDEKPSKRLVYTERAVQIVDTDTSSTIFTLPRW